MKYAETRLSQLCKAFGWQGGTIHDANKKAAQVLGMTHFCAITMKEENFQEYLETINKRMIPSDWFKE